MLFLKTKTYSRSRPRPWPWGIETETWAKWTRVSRPWSRDDNTGINQCCAVVWQWWKLARMLSYLTVVNRIRGLLFSASTSSKGHLTLLCTRALDHQIMMETEQLIGITWSRFVTAVGVFYQVSSQKQSVLFSVYDLLPLHAVFKLTKFFLHWPNEHNCSPERR